MSQQEPKKYGFSLFGETPKQKSERKERRDENIRTLNQAKALNDFPDRMDFEMKEKNPVTSKYDKGGRRTRRRKSRKSKRSKKSRKSRKHRK
jgi:hypothetical protein